MRMIASPQPVDLHVSSRDEIRKLTSLVDISQALSGTLNLRSAVHRTLEILERHHAVTYGIVVLVRSDPNEAAPVDRVSSGTKGRVRALEDLARRVVESGRPVVVPRVTQEPSLGVRAAERRGQSDELTVVVVPVVLAKRPVGALAVELAYKPGRLYDRRLEVPGRRRVHDRAGRARLQGWSRPSGSGSSTRTRTCSQELQVALRLPEPRRHERTDAAGVRPGRAGGAHEHDGAHSR